MYIYIYIAIIYIYIHTYNLRNLPLIPQSLSCKGRSRAGALPKQHLRGMSPRTGGFARENHRTAMELITSESMLGS